MWNGSSERRRDSRRQETPRDAKSVSKRVPFLFGSLSLSLLFECLRISLYFWIQYQICDWHRLSVSAVSKMSSDVSRCQIPGWWAESSATSAGWWYAKSQRSHWVHIMVRNQCGTGIPWEENSTCILGSIRSFIVARLDKLIARLLCFSMFFWFASVNHRDPMTASFDFQLSLWHILTQMQMQLGGLLDMFGDHHAGAV